MKRLVVLHGDRLADIAFNLTEEVDVTGGAEADGSTCSFGAGRTANPVYVIIRAFREVKIDDQAD